MEKGKRGRKATKKLEESKKKLAPIKEEQFSEGEDSSDEGVRTISFDMQLALPTNETEIIRNLKVPILETNEIQLHEVIVLIKQIGYTLDNTIVYFYSHDMDAWLYCGFDPLPKHIYVPKHELSDHTFKLRFSQGIKSEYAEEDGEGSEEESAMGQNERSSNIAGNKRTKERKIGYIIEKVSQWRRLYNGIPDSNGNTIRYSLEEAAQKVKVSKKSLDDYLSQLRKGRRLGFDFNKNKDEKVGVLRSFVKNNEKQ